MDPNQALAHIQELEDRLAMMEENRLPEDDRQYVERLKADMRRAAAAREASEARADRLTRDLAQTKARQKMAEAARDAGCVDIDALLTLSGDVLAETDTDDAVLDTFIDTARTRWAYLFANALPEGEVATKPTAPLVAAGRRTHPQTTLQQAAGAYRAR